MIKMIILTITIVGVSLAQANEETFADFVLNVCQKKIEIESQGKLTLIFSRKKNILKAIACKEEVLKAPEKRAFYFAMYRGEKAARIKGDENLINVYRELKGAYYDGALLTDSGESIDLKLWKAELFGGISLSTLGGFFKVLSTQKTPSQVGSVPAMLQDMQARQLNPSLRDLTYKISGNVLMAIGFILMFDSVINLITPENEHWLAGKTLGDATMAGKLSNNMQELLERDDVEFYIRTSPEKFRGKFTLLKYLKRFYTYQ